MDQERFDGTGAWIEADGSAESFSKPPHPLPD